MMAAAAAAAAAAETAETALGAAAGSDVVCVTDKWLDDGICMCKGGRVSVLMIMHAWVISVQICA